MMTVEELVKKYRISRVGENLRSENGSAIKRDGMFDELKRRKSEILAYFAEKEAAEKRAMEEYKSKIKAIEGLDELRNALADERRYHDEFEEMMRDESNDGAFPPKPIAVKYADIAPKYPRAAAFLKAEDWSYSSHYIKSSIGRRAKERIINGEDHEIVIAEMEAEWSEYCDARMWD